MFKNYFKLALRNFRKFKTYSALNLFGLAIGVACSLLILLFVENELTYDRFHQRAGHIYRLFKVEKRPTGIVQQASLPAPLAQIVAQEIPEVEQVVRLFLPFSEAAKLIRYRERWLEEKVHFADPDFLSVFTFPLLKGSAATALHDPGSVVLRDAIAEQLFGQEDPLGKTVSIRIGDKDQDFTVSGVAKSMPVNSSLKFDVLLNYQKVADELSGFFGKEVLNTWNSFTEIYVRTNSRADLAQLEVKLAAVVAKYSENLVQRWRLVAGDDAYQLQAQPLTGIHLQPAVRSGITPSRNPVHLHVLASIALLLLVLACINFTTFSIARSLPRAREVGLRKVLGADKKQIMKQFWHEAFLMTLLAFGVALMLVEFLLPAFIRLTGVTLSLHQLRSGPMLGLMAALLLFTGLTAGSYPALALSLLRPIAIFRGATKIVGKNLLLRALVAFQFVLSISLLISTLLMSRQLDYMRTKDLGFVAEQVIAIPTHDESEEGALLLDRYRNALAPYQNVVSLSGSDGSFAQNSLSMAVHTDDKNFSVATYRVDSDYLETLGISLVEGRNFLPGMPSDLENAVLINQSLVKALEWKSAIGKNVPIGFPNTEVIGVVKDYHFEPLYSEIGPVLLHLNPGRPVRYIFVRIKLENLAETLLLLKEKWQEIAARAPFAYHFLDQTVARSYEADVRLGQIIRDATVLAFAISCFGLFGLVAFAAQRRTKEIGVRKVLGASVRNVTALLSKDFVKLVLLANFLAWPLAWFAMNMWLQNFAYRIAIEWWVFLLAGGLALLIALLTVSTQAIRAALANPVEALRYE